MRNHTLLQPVILSFFLPSSVRHLLWALIKYSYSFLFHYSCCSSSWLSSSHIGIDLHRGFHNYRARTYPVVTTAALSFVVFFSFFFLFFSQLYNNDNNLNYGNIDHTDQSNALLKSYESYDPERRRKKIL